MFKERVTAPDKAENLFRSDLHPICSWLTQSLKGFNSYTNQIVVFT